MDSCDTGDHTALTPFTVGKISVRRERFGLDCAFGQMLINNS